MRRLSVCSFIMAAALAGVGSPAGSAWAAQLSAIDLHRADAAAAFGLRLDALRLLRAKATDDYRKYEGACRGKFTRGWTVGPAGIPLDVAWIPQMLVIDNQTTPECRMLVTGIKTHSQQMARELTRIDEEGRRRGIYPGVMRDLKLKYGFQ